MISSSDDKDRSDQVQDPWADAHEPQWQRWAGGAALAGLGTMAAGMSGANFLQSLGLLMLIAGSVACLPALMRRLVGDHLTIAVVLFFAYLLVSGLTATESSDPAIAHWDLVRKMSRVLLIPVVAYWLWGRESRLEWFLLLALLGMLGVIVEQWIQWRSIAPMFGTARVEFRFNPIWMGLNGSLATLGLIAFRQRLTGVLALWLTRPAAFVLWLGLLLLMIQVVIVSQSRGAYLAFVVGTCVFGVLEYRRIGMRRITVDRRRLTIIAVVFGLAVAIVANQSNILLDRLIEERETIGALLRWELESLPTTPIGQRVYMYTVGINAWLQQPWMGWGPDGALAVVSSSDLPASVYHDHLHNGPLDVLVRFGIIGAIVFYSIPLILIRAVWRSLNEGRLHSKPGHFLLSALATFAVADLTESYLASGQGWYLLMLIGGAMYTHYLWRDTTEDGGVRS